MQQGMNPATPPHWNLATVRQKVGLLNYGVSFGKKYTTFMYGCAKLYSFSLQKSVKLGHVFT